MVAPHVFFNFISCKLITTVTERNKVCNNNNSINKRAAGADALSTIYGNKPPRTKAKSQGQGWFNVA